MRVTTMVALALLAGCAPTVQDFANTCAAYGYTPGSGAMAECIEREAAAYRAAQEERADRAQRAVL